MSGRIAIGVGCRSGCSADAIEALVRQALARTTPGSPTLDEHARNWQALVRQTSCCEWPGLFTIRDKAAELGLIEAAGRLGLRLTFLSRDALREQAPFVQTRSVRAETLFGVPSVAEAAALAGAGPNAVLIVTRIAGQGATCAIAAIPDDPS